MTVEACAKVLGGHRRCEEKAVHLVRQAVGAGRRAYVLVNNRGLRGTHR